MAGDAHTDAHGEPGGPKAPDDLLPVEEVGLVGQALGTEGPETQGRGPSAFIALLRKRYTELQLVERVNALFQDGVDARREWDETASRVRDIMRSEMWPAAASTVAPEVRVQINRVRPTMLQMKSQLMQTKPSIAVRQQSPEDEDMSWVFHRQMQWSIESGQDQRILSRAMDDFGEVGIGITRDKYDTKLEDGQGDLVTQWIDPRHMVVDPNARGDGWADAWWFMQIERMRVEDAYELYPEFTGEVETEERDPTLFPERSDDPRRPRRSVDYGTQVQSMGFGGMLGTGGKDTRPFSGTFCVVKEFWYKRLVTRKMRFITDEIIAMSLGLPELFQDAGLWPIPEGMEFSDPEFDVIRHDVTDVEWWIASTIGKSLVQHVRSPYPLGHPFTFFTNRMHADSAWPSGDAEPMIGPNDLLNKLYSMMVENVAKTKNSGFLAEEDALSPSQMEDLKRLGHVPGHIALVQRNALREGRLQEAKPAQLPRGLFQLTKDLEQQLDFQAQQFEVNRGGTPYPTSGKGILALQATGKTMEQLRSHVFSFGMTDWARKRLAHMQHFFTEPKMLRIVGEAGEERFVEVNQPVHDTQGNMVKRLRDLSVGRYDVMVKIDSSKDMTRREQVEVASWLYLQKIGDAQFVLEKLEIPEKDAILQRMAARSAVEMLVQKAQQDPALGQALQYLQNPEMVALLTQIANDPNALRAMRSMGTPPSGNGAQLAPAGQGPGPADATGTQRMAA